MSTWQRIFGWLVTEIDRQPVVPPAGIVPGFPALDDTPVAAELEHHARHKAALRHIHRTLLAESLKDPGLRNTALVDFCLELRSTLQPAPADAEVLREMPPVGIRYRAPVIPGRPS
jgi:hypothetical protein